MSAQDYNFEVEKDVLEVLREFLAGSGTTGSPLNYLVTTFSAVDLRFYLKESFLNVGVSVADTVVERFIYQFPPVAITPMEMLSCGGDGSLVLHVPEHIIALPALPYYKVRSISVEGDTEKLLVLDNAWAPVFAKCKMVRRCGVTLERCVLTRPFVEVLRGLFLVINDDHDPSGPSSNCPDMPAPGSALGLPACYDPLFPLLPCCLVVILNEE